MTDPSPIRKAHLNNNDVNAIYEVIKDNPEEVLSRPYQDILAHFDRFHVFDDGEIRGVISWQVMPVIDLENPDICIEIVSFSVRGDSQGRGIGDLLLKNMIETVKSMKPHRIVVLTFYPEFFRKYGFIETSKEKLYQKLYQGCMNCTKHKSPLTCPEVAMEMIVG
ncbi:MAG: GNAT family N-acetyltransferase [bacterium]|nr:GNAT family N-acetyltransferase [bacterium]